MAPQGLQYAQNVKEQFSGSSKGVGWPKKFFTFSSVIFIFLLVIYLGLGFGYEAFLQSSIKRIKGELGSLSDQITDQQKEDLTPLYSQVTNIRDLLGGHTLTSQIFALFEVITSQKVKYTDFSLSAPDREVSIEGFAATYEDLVSQLVLFEESPQIERFTLEESEIQNGIVRFKAKVILVESILQPEAL